jgi:hypothetical protein
MGKEMEEKDLLIKSQEEEIAGYAQLIRDCREKHSRTREYD